MTVPPTASHGPQASTGPKQPGVGPGLGRLLITAGPTQEPIDQVRYIGNRSSGRLGIALAEHAAQAGWDVTLLLGPTPRTPADSRVLVHRFRTTADLHALLQAHFPLSDVLVMAAAVADYRPKKEETDAEGKIRRLAGGLTLHLEPTPDLLAGCAAHKRPGQLVVGFALEPRSRLMESAKSKLQRKSLDLIVANPLETMDAGTIEAVVLGKDGTQRTTDGAVEKDRFADFLLGILAERQGAR